MAKNFYTPDAANAASLTLAARTLNAGAAVVVFGFIGNTTQSLICKIGGSTTGVTQVLQKDAANTAFRLYVWVKENVSAGSATVSIETNDANAAFIKCAAVEDTDAPTASVVDVSSSFEGNAGIDAVAHAAAVGGVTIASGSTAYAWFQMDRTSTRTVATGWAADTVVSDVVSYPYLAHKVFASGATGERGTMADNAAKYGAVLVAIKGTAPAAPTLSTTSAAATGNGTASGTVTTTGTDGTLYAVRSAVQPTNAQIVAGLDSAGAASSAGSLAITTAGAKTVALAGVAVPAGSQTVWFLHRPGAGAGSDSNVVSAAWTQPAALAWTGTYPAQSGTAGAAFVHSGTIPTPTGGIGAKSYSAAGLGASGLTMNSSTGQLQGTAGTAGTYTITPTVTDQSTAGTPAPQTAPLAAFTLTIASAGTAPSISVQPSNQTVTAGATATFSVTASGSGTLTYQWQRNGTNISGATASSYTTPATTVSGGNANSGDLFRCVVTGDTSPAATSNAATLTVNAPGDTTAPTLTGAIAISGLTSDGYTATCPVATDNVAVTGYQWRLGGSGAFTDIAAGGRAFTFTGRTPSTTDALEMRARDAAGNVSAALSASIDLPAVVGITYGFDLDTHPDMIFGQVVGALVGISREAAVQINVRAYRADTGALVAASGALTTDADGRLPRWEHASLAGPAVLHHLLFIWPDGAIDSARLETTA